MTQHDRLLIIDFGSQVTQLDRAPPARAERLLRNPPVPERRRCFPDGVRAQGRNPLGRAVQSVIDDGSPRPPESVFTLGVPVLGICYGQQVMMHDAGRSGRTRRRHSRIRPRLCHALGHNPCHLLDGWFLTDEQVWMSHGDHVSKIAPGFEVFGTSPNAPYAIDADPARNFFAVQFHPEVHHTPNGAKLYENFVRSPASPATGPWAPTATKRSRNPRAGRRQPR